MSDKKISQLAAITTPLVGTEQLPAVQSGSTKKVTVAQLQNGLLKTTDIGSTVQGYDVDTAKLDIAQIWSATQTFNSGAVFNEFGADVDFRIESNTNANAFFLDGDTGNIGIENGDPVAKLDIGTAGNLPGGNVILGIKTNNQNKYSQICASHYSNSTYPEGFTLIGSETTATTSSLMLGGFFGSNKATTDIRFFTAANNTTNAGTERLKIDVAGNTTINNGNLVIGTSGKGIDFSADGQAAGMTSELLDDYEEGTWTPTQGAGLTVVGDFTSSGTYTKVGRQVTVVAKINGSTSVAASSGGVICAGLPFTVSGDSTGARNNVELNESGSVYLQTTSVYAIGAIAATGSIYFTATYFV